jgi:hypothetical protein
MAPPRGFRYWKYKMENRLIMNERQEISVSGIYKRESNGKFEVER